MLIVSVSHSEVLDQVGLSAFKCCLECVEKLVL